MATSTCTMLPMAGGEEGKKLCISFGCVCVCVVLGGVSTSMTD